MAIAPGEQAPGFSLPDQDGIVRNLADFRGRWLVLYFYPQDDTPGCTVEAQEFTLLKPEFGKRDAVVIGISEDTKESHCSFIEKHLLDLILLTDAEHTVMELYDAYGTKMLYGKEVLGVKRSTVLINPEGKVAHQWRSVQPEGHARHVLGKLEELQGANR